MNELAPVAPVSDMELVWKLAQRLCDTDFVPDAFRSKPNAVLAAILTGREVGIGPMQALQSINVIKGKPSLAPELQRALVLRAGHSVVFRTLTNDVCVIHGKRADNGDELTIEWTIADAQQAGLLSKGGSWDKYPRAMLAARATSELCRLLFPDVIAGCSYGSEELGADPEPSTIADPETGEVIEIVAVGAVEASQSEELPAPAVTSGDDDPLTSSLTGPEGDVVPSPSPSGPDYSDEDGRPF